MTTPQPSEPVPQAPQTQPVETTQQNPESDQNVTTQPQNATPTIDSSNTLNTQIPVTSVRAPDKATAAKLKQKGNQAWKVGDIQAAIQSYTEALEHDPQAPDLLRNRSAAYVALRDFEKALEDSNAAIALDPSAKSYCRLAEVHLHSGVTNTSIESLEKALETYKKANSLEQDAELKYALEQSEYFLRWMKAFVLNGRK